MSNFLITGRPGTGKSTIVKELQRRGLRAYDTDVMTDVTKFQNISSGEIVEWPEDKVDWTKYAWNWQEDALRNLLSDSERVFIGAITSNQERFYPLFNKIFALVLSPENLRIHLEQHGHASHHQPGEIERRVSQHESKQRQFLRDDFALIDANKPVEEIVDDILLQT